ncbi:hypothetical protein ACOZ4N_01250 (plasmid) [Halorientalis pallida]|uniref:hypothetical protein n=1 Tax=Halorientalis pallida TaxID=2479928 RepID=UPI003C6FE9CA
MSGEVGSNPSEEQRDFSPAGDLAFEDVVVEVTESEVDYSGYFESEWPTIDINSTTEEFTATGTTYTRYLCHEWEIIYMGLYDRHGYITIKKAEDEPDGCDFSGYVRHEIQIQGQFTGGVPERLTVQFDEHFMHSDETTVEIN